MLTHLFDVLNDERPAGAAIVSALFGHFADPVADLPPAPERARPPLLVLQLREERRAHAAAARHREATRERRPARAVTRVAAEQRGPHTHRSDRSVSISGSIAGRLLLLRLSDNWS